MRAEDVKVGMRVRITGEMLGGNEGSGVGIGDVGTVVEVHNGDACVLIGKDDWGWWFRAAHLEPVEQHKEPYFFPFVPDGEMSELDDHLEKFIDGMRERHYAAKPVHGDASLHKSISSSLTDMREELLDLANYAAYTAAKIERIRERIVGPSWTDLEEGD